MANTNLRETAFCLIGGLRKAEDTIQHCFSIAGVGDDTTWDSPGLLDKNCREVFDALRDCSVAFVKFREAFEPCQKDVSKHVGGYQLERPKGFLSHLTKLSKQSSVVLNSLADICNRGGDFRNWYVSNPPWLESDWWDSLKIQPRPQLDNLLDALQTRVEEYRPMIESITEGDFCENILQEIEVVELEFEPRNTPGGETAIDENHTQKVAEPFRVELDEDSRVLYFGTESFDRLTGRIVSFLRVFVENWNDGNKVMKVGEINKRAKENTTSGFLDDAFKVNRKNESIHRVSTIIEQVSDGYYRFRDPRKAKN